MAKSPASSTPDPVTAALQAIGFALSARALLLIALVGAFVLAVMAMLAQTLPSLEVLIAYAIFTVIPVSYLEVRRRQSL
jgi:multidrug transporter EmrE-like cation transporter